MRGKPVTTSGRLVHTSSIAGVYFARSVNIPEGASSVRLLARWKVHYFSLDTSAARAAKVRLKLFRAPYRPINHIQLGDVVACSDKCGSRESLSRCAAKVRYLVTILTVKI